MWCTCKGVVLLSNIYKPVCFSDVAVPLGLYHYMLSTCLLKLTTTFFLKLTIFCRKHCIIMQIIVTTCHNVINILRCWNICFCYLFAFVIKPQIYSEKKVQWKFHWNLFQAKILEPHRLSNLWVCKIQTFFNHWRMLGAQRVRAHSRGREHATPENFELFMLFLVFWEDNFCLNVS